MDGTFDAIVRYVALQAAFDVMMWNADFTGPDLRLMLDFFQLRQHTLSTKQLPECRTAVDTCEVSVGGRVSILPTPTLPF